MSSTNSFLKEVWKLTKFKLEEYHFFTGKLTIILLLGISIGLIFINQPTGYMIEEPYTTTNFLVSYPIVLLWLVYVGFSIGTKKFLKHDISLTGSYKVSFLSNYLYLIILSFISVLLIYLSKYPLILIQYFINDYDWLIIDEGWSAFFHFIGYGLATLIFLVSASYMCGVGGGWTISIFVAIIIVLNLESNLIGVISEFIVRGMFHFWVVVFILSTVMNVVGYQFYRKAGEQVNE